MVLRGFSIGSVLLLLQNCELPSLQFICGAIFKDFHIRKVGARSPFVLSQVSHHLDLSASQKATGLDDVPSLFQGDSAESINISVAHIYSLSISSEIVPTAFNEAKG